MKVNISSVKKELGSRQPFTFEFDAADLFEKDETTWIYGSVRVEGFVVNTGKTLEVQGLVKAVAELSCNRCLVAFQSDFEIPFRESCRQDGADQEQAEDSLLYCTGDEIELSELVREAVVLAEPLKAVCRENCKGLCSRCGVNLNISSCKCEQNVIDPRLAALEQLLRKD